MATVNPKELLNNLYGLMMEINMNQAEEDVLEELNAAPDPFVEKHLRKVKQLSARFKAETNKQRYEAAIKQLKLLKEKGLDELKRLIRPEHQVQLQPLFRKFEELTPEDEASIIEDQEMLSLMEILNKRIKEDE